MERQLKVLITAEDKNAAAFYTQELKKQNIQVICCEKDGAKALAILEQERPDAALLNVFMPALDALAVKERYEAQHGAAAAFYAMGTVDSEELSAQIMGEGFHYYYLKPFDIALFGARLRKQMGAGRAPAGKAEALVVEVTETSEADYRSCLLQSLPQREASHHPSSAGTHQHRHSGRYNPCQA